MKRRTVKYFWLSNLIISGFNWIFLLNQDEDSSSNHDSPKIISSQDIKNASSSLVDNKGLKNASSSLVDKGLKNAASSLGDNTGVKKIDLLGRNVFLNCS